MPQAAPTLGSIKRLKAAPRPDNRPSAAARGYGHRWRRARKAYLKARPLCVQCRFEDMVTQATVVDHIMPHKGDMKKFWDRSNWQGLCKCHHDIKTATEDGGFGNSLK